MSKKKGDPFFLFAIFSLLSSLLLGGILYSQCRGYALGNINSHISSTLSIPMFAIFVPLFYAAIIYCKTKLSQTAPEIFSELTIDNMLGLAVVVLGVLFLTSLATPLMEMENAWYGFLQLCLILCSFALSGSFVWGIFKVAKYSKMLQVFGETARNKLKDQILKFGNEEDEHSKNQVSHIIENFISMANVNIKRGSRKDLGTTLKELQLYIYAFFRLINKKLVEIGDPRVNYSRQTVHDNLRSIGRLEELHKLISDLLFVELTKLIHGTSNVKEEKYLESFIPLLQEVIPKTLSVNTGYHSEQWSNFINETTFRTAVLKHTTYPNAVIDLYKELIIWDFRYNPSGAVYGLSFKLHGLLKIIDALKSKEVSFKIWYRGLQAKVINLMLSMLPMCTKYRCDRLIIQKWAESIGEIITEVYSEDSNQLMDGSPVLSIIQTLSPNSLPFMYQQAADNIFSTDYDDQIKLRQLNTLKPVYSIYRALIGKDKDRPGELSQCLASQFYIDLQICTNIHEEFVDCWIESLSEEYKDIFEELEDNYINKGNRIDIFERERTLSIPAIALVTNQENQIKLGNEIVIRFADMLISIFNKKDPKDANGWERANILLLSAWLKKTDRLQEKREELETVLSEYPYSNFSTYMTDYEAYGYASTSLRKWYLPPSTVWANNIQKQVDTELMDLGFLVKYGEQFRQ